MRIRAAEGQPREEEIMTVSEIIKKAMLAGLGAQEKAKEFQERGAKIY